MHLGRLGLNVFHVYDQHTGNICKNATNFTAPAGDDAGYHCPHAGLYNIRTRFTLPGSPSSWWSSLYGMEVDFVLTIWNGTDVYSKCYLDVLVQDGDDGASMNGSMGFLGLVGLSGLAAGLVIRKKRKSKVAKIEIDDNGDDGECHSHFELISEGVSRV